MGRLLARGTGTSGPPRPRARGPSGAGSSPTSRGSPGSGRRDRGPADHHPDPGGGGWIVRRVRPGRRPRDSTGGIAPGVRSILLDQTGWARLGTLDRALDRRWSPGPHLGHEQFGRRGDLPLRAARRSGERGDMTMTSAVRAVRAGARTVTMAGVSRHADAVSAAGCTVHVVDDDASVRKSLQRLVGAAGYRVQSYD